MGEINLPQEPIQTNGGDDKYNTISHFKQFSAGAGSGIIKQNSEGFFIGNDNFTDAPFSVDFDGKATATVFVDKTYGFNGVFTKVFSTTATTGSTQYVIEKNGGLIGILVNMLDTGDPNPSFIDVPSWNGLSVNWECIQSGGNYIITIYNENIHNDYFPLTKIFTTVFFNSLETEGF